MRLSKGNVRSAVAIVLLLPVLPADMARSAGIAAGNAWIRALPAGLPSAGYVTITNGTPRDMILTGAGSVACKRLSLHKSEITGGICRMRDLPEVDIPAFGSIAFTPGSYHLMCEGLDPRVKPGMAVDVTLAFKDGARLPVRFAVRNAAGK